MDKFWLTLFGFVVLAVDRLTRRPDSAPTQAEPQPEEEEGPPAHWQAQFGQSQPPAHWLKALERAEDQPEWLEYSEMAGQSEGVWPVAAENREENQPQERTAKATHPIETTERARASNRPGASNRSPLLHPVSRNAFDARLGTASPGRADAIRPDAGDASARTGSGKDSKVIAEQTAETAAAPVVESEAGEAYPRSQNLSPAPSATISGSEPGFSAVGARREVPLHPEDALLPHPVPAELPSPIETAFPGRPAAQISSAKDTPRPRRGVTIAPVSDKASPRATPLSAKPTPVPEKPAPDPLLSAPTRSALHVADEEKSWPSSSRSPMGAHRVALPSGSEGRTEGEGPGVRKVDSTPISPVGVNSGGVKNPPLPPLRKGGKNLPAVASPRSPVGAHRVAPPQGSSKEGILAPLSKRGEGGILRPFPTPEESTKTDPSWSERTPQAYGKWPDLDNEPALDELDWTEATQAQERIARLEREQGGL